jgi:hypothetical protein
MRERELFSWSEFLCVLIGTSSTEGYVDSISIALCLYICISVATNQRTKILSLTLFSKKKIQSQNGKKFFLMKNIFLKTLLFIAAKSGQLENRFSKS